MDGEKMTEKPAKIGSQLQVIGIVGMIVGLIAFGISFLYMGSAVKYGTIGPLAETLFFGLLGTTAFLAGTIVYLKKWDYS